MAETNENVASGEDIVKLIKQRADTYGLLARLYRKEVDAETLQELQSMRFPVATGSEDVDKGYRSMYNYLKGAWDDSVNELAIDFVRTFIGHGVNGYSAAYPYESVYTSERRLMMQEARKEVLKTFRANHLKRGSWTEGEDHIALELEFMQRLNLRAAEDLEKDDQDAALEELEKQLEFLRNHLLNWLPMLTADMHKFAHTEFYQGLATLTKGYVELDEKILSELVGESELEEG